MRDTNKLALCLLLACFCYASVDASTPSYYVTEEQMQSLKSNVATLKEQTEMYKEQSTKARNELHKSMMELERVKSINKEQLNTLNVASVQLREQEMQLARLKESLQKSKSKNSNKWLYLVVGGIMGYYISK